LRQSLSAKRDEAQAGAFRLIEWSALKSQFCERFQIDRMFQDPNAKIIYFRFSEFYDLCSRIPRLQRGALRDRHECWARDAMDGSASTDE